MSRLTFFLYSFLCLSGIVLGGNFNVMKNGAKADGKTDDAKAFEATWKEACESKGPATILIPKGTYSMGPIRFPGPCKDVPTITMKMDGTLKALTDLTKYPTGDWIYFAWLSGLTLTGSGTFDGQGDATWHLNDCRDNPNCKRLPTNLKFVAMNDTVINGIESLNSKNFHFGVLECNNFKATNLKITAPDESPNTDGMHVERCTDVILQDIKIGTGDDCISLGQGLSNVFISGITCGPGHGISIGSLGKYPNEKDVKGLVIEDCNFQGTTNGIRIKTWQNCPSPSAVSNITFNNIDMKDVENPIIIDQLYCPSGKCSNKTPSRVKISDVTFKNIKGTYRSRVGITLNCSSLCPCKNVKLEKIDLEYAGQKTVEKTSCVNVDAQFIGKQNPAPCPLK